jgi:hypothetical protein
MKNPYLQLVFFSVLILFITWAYMQLGGYSLSRISWLAFGFFVLLTAAVYSILSPSLKTNGKQFVQLFMSTQGLRMFFSLGFLILYLLFVEKREVAFIIYFLLLYLSFTGFEIYLLLSNLRADLKKESTQE